MRAKEIMSEIVSGYDPRQTELFPISDTVKAERVAHQLAETPFFKDRYDPKYAARMIINDVVTFFDSMWENRKGAGNNPKMIESLAEVWPYNGPCYRIMGVSISSIPSWKIDRYPALKRMLIGKFDPKDEEAKNEFYRYLTTEIEFRPYDSWSKSLEGVQNFDDARHKHTRNVIYRGLMRNGLDYHAMAMTLVEIGALSRNRKVQMTELVEEVIGKVHNPVPIRWKMVKWFREDHPADMVIDGKKYRWTERGTLVRVPASKR